MHFMKYPVIAMAVSAVLATIFTGMLIPYLEKKQLRQYEREEGPQSHKVKTGTPSMGGFAMICAIIVTSALMAIFVDDARSVSLIVFSASMIMFAFIGWLDDYRKATKKNNDGLSARQKLILQFCIALAVASMGYFLSGSSAVKGSEIWIPIFDKYLDLGIFYIPFQVFVLMAFTNSVNLTDGLDGLASGVTAMVAFCMVIVGAIYSMNDTIIAYGALSGACLGFLVHNKYPAKIIMGDTGSMALGGSLAAGAIMMKMELVLAVAGLLYVLESLSVIIQVGHYKRTKRRIFKMSPIHHHFELCGMKEKNVVFMFWGVTLVFCLVAILIAIV